MNPNDDAFLSTPYPRAILHVDGDAFFTSVEQAVHPDLRGRPVITGKERGIISCASYEAKRLGIKRGVSLWDAQKICPDVVILPSDYETYSLFSKRMFEIMRRYTPDVEEYSIDEGFADITAMRAFFRCPYKEIAVRLQETVRKELDLTVSVGLSVTKSLAKIASDFRKPSGITAVDGKHIHLFLQQIPLEDIWGIGPSSQQLLKKHGLRTAYDFVQRDEKWVLKQLHKPGWEIWQELRGNSLRRVDTAIQQPPASISKSKTFSAVSSDRNIVYAKLMRNLESALIKLRRHALNTQEITLSLRNKEYIEYGLTARPPRPASTVHELSPFVLPLFNQLYRSGIDYRATTVILSRLKSDRARQYELFDDPIALERIKQLGPTIDRINHRYGKHRIFAGTGLFLRNVELNPRDEPSWRKTHLLTGETTRKRLRLPLLNMQV